MNLEDQLAALKPRAPSPALKAALALQLGRQPRAQSWLTRLKSPVVAAGFATAAATIALLALTPYPAERLDNSPPNPTARAYWQAFEKSPEELDRCLDRDAAKMLVSTGAEHLTARFH